MRPTKIAWAALGLAASACGGDSDKASESVAEAAPGAGRGWAARDPAVAIESVPAGAHLQPVRFRFRIDYRGLPAGSGLLVTVGDSRGGLSDGGGTLMEVPVPVEGSGSVELAFEGFAITAPADAPLAHSVPPGEYRLRARIGDSRNSPFSMVDNAGRELASAESGTFTIAPGGAARKGYWPPRT